MINGKKEGNQFSSACFKVSLDERSKIFFLTDCDVYLPPIQFANSNSIKGVLRVTTNVISLDNYHPHYNCLSKHNKEHPSSTNSRTYNRENSWISSQKFDLKSYLQKYKKARIHQEYGSEI